ncbi:MAG: replication factor C small subunit [Candidatus Thorarchaeota archaeon]
MVTLERMWTELFRPRTLDEVVGQSEIVKRLKQFVHRVDFPHMLFSGPPGVGKTTCAEAIVNEIFPSSERSSNVKRLNASDDRGINVVRQDIKNFARILPSGSSSYKIIILDEADQMTSDAQHALRQTMERYNEITRFILICNYSSKIISPIQSRCAIFRFSGLDIDDIKSRLKYIAKKKQLEVDEEALDALYESSEGDLRQAINALQASAAITPEVTVEVIYQVQGYVKPKEVRAAILECLETQPNFSAARKQIQVLMETYGLSGQDLVKHLNRELSRMTADEISEPVRYSALSMLSEVDYRIATGSNPQVQLDAFLAKMISVAQKQG